LFEFAQVGGFEILADAGDIRAHCRQLRGETTANVARNAGDHGYFTLLFLITHISVSRMYSGHALKWRRVAR
jgi:hypothetical protein